MVTIAALLSVEDLFVHPRSQSGIESATKAHSRLFDDSGDHITLLHIFTAYKEHKYSSEWARDNFFHARALKMASNIRTQLVDIVTTRLVPYMQQ